MVRSSYVSFSSLSYNVVKKLMKIKFLEISICLAGEGRHLNAKP